MNFPSAVGLQGKSKWLVGFDHSWDFPKQMDGESIKEAKAACERMTF